MLYEEAFQAPDNVDFFCRRCEELVQQTGPVKLMEICGTHTMAIGKSGIRSILPKEISLLSGPGCPVCVTPASVMEEIFDLAQNPDIILTCYGDLLRIPGSRPGENLLLKKAQGQSIESVYSPVDALQLAKSHPQKEVVFIGIGFETTAPGTAAVIAQAAAENIPNFSVLSLLKCTPPALRSLIESPDFAVNGFLCPGHVAAITGSQAFAFLSTEYKLPGVVSGFEAGDLLYSIVQLMEMLAAGKPDVKNEYTRLVRPEGNTAALKIIEQTFCLCESDWRGLGVLPESGYAIRDAYRAWDAQAKFSLSPHSVAEPPGCHCPQIIRGIEKPAQCPLFGTACLPEHPVGPCMVSSEGSCAAAYHYE